RDFEFIIINDQSTDDTGQIIERYAKKDPRIRYLINPKNLGIAGNRNRGVAEARGTYVVWQDADDISLPTRLQKQVEFMDTHPHVGICGSYLQFFDDSGDLSVR